MGLERIVSKRKDSHSRSGRSPLRRPTSQDRKAGYRIGRGSVRGYRNDFCNRQSVGETRRHRCLDERVRHVSVSGRGCWSPPFGRDAGGGFQVICQQQHSLKSKTIERLAKSGVFTVEILNRIARIGRFLEHVVQLGEERANVGEIVTEEMLQSIWCDTKYVDQ
jgi:hypothetical protein